MIIKTVKQDIDNLKLKMANSQFDKNTYELYQQAKINSSNQKFFTENSEEKKDSQAETEATFSIIDSLNGGGVKCAGFPRVDKTASFKNFSLKELQEMEKMSTLSAND